MSYSSLIYLKRFPVEGIKIDRTFVAPMTNDETQRAIVQAILALGTSLSINVIAEGIETDEQADALLDLGCVFGQGYLLGRPMTAAESVRALRAQQTVRLGPACRSAILPLGVASRMSPGTPVARRSTDGDGRPKNRGRGGDEGTGATCTGARHAGRPWPGCGPDVHEVHH